VSIHPDLVPIFQKWEEWEQEFDEVRKEQLEKEFRLSVLAAIQQRKLDQHVNFRDFLFWAREGYRAWRCRKH
jgi:hypothetical protein